MVYAISAMIQRLLRWNIKEEHPRGNQTTLICCWQRHLPQASPFQTIMRVVDYLFLVTLSEIASYGSGSRGHVHLKILVPDIIKHHIHTKTVFLRVPALKKPKAHHKEYHRENWSSWSSYGHRHGYEDENLHPLHPEDHENQQKKDSVDPELGQEGYSYAVHEDVRDIPPRDVEAVSYNYEEGYSKGLRSESGHVRADQSSKFHDDQHEEQDDAENDGTRDEFHEKTDAGRYLVDDVEYENTRDKRDGKRRLRRIPRISVFSLVDV
ncbi:uncharacterized protein LOC143373713 [Andrena cerasifolii]|uniref:uncharacterized protein LOC143373713 n=1 Tax=Andrena cerasifolii TaxID=2819439 RepID=UPI0040378397